MTVKLNYGIGIPVNSYTCQLVPMSTCTTHRCQVVPQVMSTRTTIRFQLVPNKASIRWWYELTYITTQYMPTRTHVNSYSCQLVLMSTRTTNRCQVVPKVMPARTTIIFQLVPNKASIRWWYELTSFTTQQMPTRTHVNSYPCQLVPLVAVKWYHNWCQLVPNQASIKIMMVRFDISYYIANAAKQLVSWKLSTLSFIYRMGCLVKYSCSDIVRKSTLKYRVILIMLIDKSTTYMASSFIVWSTVPPPWHFDIR